MLSPGIVGSEIKSKMAVSAAKSSPSVLSVFTRCSRCGGSWLSDKRYRLFSDCNVEGEKRTHFGYERVSEEEKKRKGQLIIMQV